MNQIASIEPPVNSLERTRIYSVPRALLNLIGIWPQKNGKIPIRFYVLSILLCSASVASIAYGLINIKHLNDALQALCPSLFEFVTWIKLMIFWYQLKAVTQLLTTFLDYYNQGRCKKSTISAMAKNSQKKH